MANKPSQVESSIRRKSTREPTELLPRRCPHFLIHAKHNAPLTAFFLLQAILCTTDNKSLRDILLERYWNSIRAYHGGTHHYFSFGSKYLGCSSYLSIQIQILCLYYITMEINPQSRNFSKHWAEIQRLLKIKHIQNIHIYIHFQGYIKLKQKQKIFFTYRKWKCFFSINFIFVLILQSLEYTRHIIRWQWVAFSASVSSLNIDADRKDGLDAVYFFLSWLTFQRIINHEMKLSKCWKFIASSTWGQEERKPFG